MTSPAGKVIMLELTNSLFYLISKTEGGCSGNRKYMIIETALYQDVLEHSSIFRQLPKDKYPNVLRCLNARVVDYPQDASIAASGFLRLLRHSAHRHAGRISGRRKREPDHHQSSAKRRCLRRRVCVCGQVASHVYIHTVEKSKILMLDFARSCRKKHFPAPAVCRSPPI